MNITSEVQVRIVSDLLVSVRKQFEFLESVVIQEWWPDSRRVTDVDREEPRTLQPQQVAKSYVGNWVMTV